MQATINTYHDRIAEIELYYQALQELYEKQQTAEIVTTFYSDDFLKMLKSNALLMVYNLVESSILGGILEIYGELKNQGLSYRTVREEIQQIWFSFIFNKVYDKNAHYNSYKNKAAEIINAILKDEPIVLDRKATSISGNLDADEIRHICDEHGIHYTLTAECKGGRVLADVKNKRNDLAHGTTSFVECGRDYTIDDLEKIKNQTVLFLNSILDGMKTYYDEKKYLSYVG